MTDSPDTRTEADVARLVCAGLLAHGFERLFCLPGVQNDNFFDAFFDVQDRIPPLMTRHEQACSYMAVGAALASGRPQAYAVVPGQGVLNAAAGHSVAWATGAPVFALHGQIPGPAIDKGLGLLHEIGDQTGAIRSTSKSVERVMDGGPEAVSQVARTLNAATSGRPGPAVLEVPVTSWAKPAAWTPAELRGTPEPLPLDDDALEAAAKALAHAKNPLIVAGAGAQCAPEALRRLAELLKAPVTSGMMGKGALDARHPLWVEFPVAHQLWPKTDVVLGFGSRLSMLDAWGHDPDLTVIQITADAAEPARRGRTDIAITALVETAGPALADRIERHLTARDDPADRLAGMRAEMSRTWAHIEPQLSYLRVLRETLAPEDIVVKDLTQVGFVARFSWPAYEPRTYLSSGYSGALGWGFPAALGAKAAMPDRRVVALCGDGGFLYCSNDLATAVKYSLAVTAIVWRDDAYGNVKRIQQERFGHNRTIVSDLVNPDFVKYAESFGAQGLRADGPEGLRTALQEAFRHDGPTVIEVPVPDPMPSPWEFILLRGGKGAAGPTRRIGAVS